MLFYIYCIFEMFDDVPNLWSLEWETIRSVCKERGGE